MTIIEEEGAAPLHYQAHTVRQLGGGRYGNPETHGDSRTTRLSVGVFGKTGRGGGLCAEAVITVRRRVNHDCFYD